MNTSSLSALEQLESVLEAVENEIGACFFDPELRLEYARRLRSVAQRLQYVTEDLIADHERLCGEKSL